MTVRTEPGSIESSLVYLQCQQWWRRFREGRRDVPLLDDALWVGHFCRWLLQQHLKIEACTRSQLNEYLATLSSFRPGPRAACQRTTTALIAFLSDPPGGPTAPIARPGAPERAPVAQRRHEVRAADGHRSN
jgi:hypothetical protein